MYTSKLIPNLFAIILLLAFAFSCGKDNEDPTPTYVNHEVAFFIDHQSVVIAPPVYETVTYQRLSKPEHKDGATFETTTEQVLVKEQSMEYSISSDHVFSIITNMESGATSDVTCRSFLDAMDIEVTIIPAEYATVEKEIIVQDGTGSIIPAQYSSYQIDIVDSEASYTIQPNPNRNSEIVTFRLESGISVNDHIQSELAIQSITGCLNGDSYLIQ